MNCYREILIAPASADRLVAWQNPPKLLQLIKLPFWMCCSACKEKIPALAGGIVVRVETYADGLWAAWLDHPDCYSMSSKLSEDGRGTEFDDFLEQKNKKAEPPWWEAYERSS